MVVLDSTTLLLFLFPDASPPLNPETNEPVENAKERIEYLIQRLDKAGTKIIIPTPVLSEVLVRSGTAAEGHLNILNKYAVFRVVAFDQRAAIEVAAMTREAKADGDKKSGLDGTWNKIKYDRQIAAIARVEQASTIYTDDENLVRLAAGMGIDVVQLHELPLPPEDPQMTLGLLPTENNENPQGSDHET